jgi:20S proteasome subunit alpha 7
LLPSPSSLQALASRLSLYASAFTLYSSVRPFGISTILGGIDSETDEPQLYMIEPSGVFWGYHGCAIGKGRQLAKTEIEKLDLKTLEVKDAVQYAANM